MHIVKILGGLGNQMFQYAFSIELEKRLAKPVYLDTSSFDYYKVHNGFELGNVFGIKPRVADLKDVRRLSTQAKTIAGRLRRKYFTKKTHFIDRYFGFYENIFEDLDARYYDGYWQSEKYFSGSMEEVKQTFTFSADPGEKNLDFLSSLKRPALSLHIRRGDYLKSNNLNICGADYYNRALKLALKEAEPQSILVFSDDHAWCKANIDFPNDRTIQVDWNPGMDGWKDMFLMSQCEHNIIANSSFSWWAAWLNKNESKKIYTPKIWNRRQVESHDPYYSFKFDDIIPENWVRVKNELR